MEFNRIKFLKNVGNVLFNLANPNAEIREKLRVPIYYVHYGG
jgi:hypothetical protein